MTHLRDELARAIARARFDKKEWTGACSKNERTEYLVNTYWRNDLPESDAILPILAREIAAARKAALEEAAKCAEANQLTGVPHGLTVMEAEIGRTMHAMTRNEIAAAIRKLGE
jgi:hypothetical protein